MNGLSFQDRLQQRLTACAVIAAVHVGLFAVLTAARPEFVHALTAEPIEVGFIAEQEQVPEPWQPPAPDVVPVTVITTLPQTITVETQLVSERAITVAPLPAVTSPPTRVGGDAPKLVSAVEYVRPPVPRYPQASRRQREQGVVILRVLIDPAGHAARIEIHQSSGFSRLDDAALEAVERAEFKPYIEEGVVQAAFVLIPIEFSLNSQGNGERHHRHSERRI